MTMNLEQVEGVPVNGLYVKKAVSTQGKKEDDMGKLSITLEAQKDEIGTGAYNLGDVIAALNSHQEGQHPIVIKVLMPTNLRPDPTRVLAAQTALAAEQQAL